MWKLCTRPRGNSFVCSAPDPAMRLLLLLLALCALAEGVSVKLEPHASKCFWTDKLEKGQSSFPPFCAQETRTRSHEYRV